MKTFSFTLALLASALFSFAQTGALYPSTLRNQQYINQLTTPAATHTTASVERVQDSLHVSRWDDNAWWVLMERIHFTHNPAGLVDERLTLMYDSVSAAWISNTRSRYTYTAFDSVALVRNEMFNSWDNSWMETGRERRTFTASHQLDSLVSEYWNGTEWITQRQETHAYDAQDSLTDHTTFHYMSGLIWMGMREVNSYTAGLLDSTVTMNWDTAANTWLNETKDVYIYNASNVVEKILNYEVDSATQAWVMVSEALIAYDGAGRMATVTYREDAGGGVMMNSLRQSYLYNAAGQLAKLTMEFPNFLGAGWIRTDEQTWTYHADGYLTSYLQRMADFLSGGFTLKNYEKHDFFWNAKPATGVAPAAAIGIVLANPATPGASVQLTGLSGDAAFTVMDLAGRVMTRETVAGTASLPVSLMPGWYLVQVTSETAETSTLKVLVTE